MFFIQQVTDGGEVLYYNRRFKRFVATEMQLDFDYMYSLLEIAESDYDEANALVDKSSTVNILRVRIKGC